MPILIMVIIMKICFGSVGIILIHGLSRDINEIRPLSKRLRLLGYKVKTPLLREKKTSFGDWFKNVENTFLELRQSCKDIIIIGYSMGGLLSLYLASKYKVKGLITLNTPIFLSDFFRQYTTLKYLPIITYLKFRKLLKKIKKLIPQIRCDISINQSINEHFHLSRSTNYLYNKIQCKIKKRLFYKNYRSIDIMIDLVKYIEDII